MLAGTLKKIEVSVGVVVGDIALLNINIFNCIFSNEPKLLHVAETRPEMSTESRDYKFVAIIVYFLPYK